MNKLATTRQQAQAGFTLIELLIVVAILGLLAAIGIPQYQGYQATAKINATKTIHSSTAKYLAAELAKCSAGSTDLILNQTSCGATVAAIGTALITYVNANNQNPYDAAKVAASGTAGTEPGTTYVVVNGNSFDVYSYFTSTDKAATAPVKTQTINIVKE